MENEIKVGEYIRTKKHGIFKVKEIRKTPYGYLCGKTDNEKVPTFTIGKGGTAEIKNDIVKHSPKLIDLIQCGDYVNEHYVYGIDDYGRTKLIDTERDLFEKKDIKTIVTKEQFESISYKVTKM